MTQEFPSHFFNDLRKPKIAPNGVHFLECGVFTVYFQFDTVL